MQNKKISVLKRFLFIVLALGTLHFSLYTDLWAEDAHAFPNPYVASKNSTGGIVTILPVPVSGTVKIYTINGQEVRSLNIETGLGKVEWDTHNTNGKLVATGVYYFRVNGDGTETVGKLIIIR